MSDLTPAEAAKRLRAYRQRVANNEVDSDDFLKSVGECYPVLVEAYLEQNPADDEEAIDEAWLQEQGFEIAVKLRLEYTLGLVRYLPVCGPLEELWFVGEQMIPNITTRRDLRGLLRGLGK